jgi:hypothetical protein
MFIYYRIIVLFLYIFFVKLDDSIIYNIQDIGNAIIFGTSLVLLSFFMSSLEKKYYHEK